MDSAKNSLPRRKSSKAVSLWGTLRGLRGSFRAYKGSDSGSTLVSEPGFSPVTPIDLDVKRPNDSGLNGSAAKGAPYSPITLDPQKEIPVANDSGALSPMGHKRADSARKRDGSSGRQRSARLNRLRRVVQVDEAEKVNLRSRLRAILHAVENTLVHYITEHDLESNLEENDFVLDRAASDLLERSGLRQIAPNSTLKKIDYKDDHPGVKNSWSYCDPSVFNVRCGPQYRKNKLKAPARPEAIYDMIAVDMYSSPEKIEHMSRFMKLQDLERDVKSHPLPSIFVVNFMLPLCEPRMFGGDQNGSTVQFHFIMKLSEWAKQNPDDPSVQLAARFINDSGPNGAMRERLKIIVQVANPEQMELGKVERGLCRQYNGLPFLYRSYNSRYHRGFGWFQADFDGHKSGYATRYARHSLLGWSHSIVANVAFLVEAETDDEMPERILGCANVHRMHCRNAPAFVKPVATPLSPNTALRRHLEGSAALSDSDVEEKGSLLEEGDEEFRDAISGEE